jgi:PAS domain-containing protein
VLADEQRREATERLQLVIQQSGDAVIVADADGVVRIFNPAAERLYGVSGRGCRPRSGPSTTGCCAWMAHRCPTRRRRSTAPSERPARPGFPVAGAARRRDATPDERHGGAAADGRRAPAGAVLIARDETARLAAERERERLLDEMRRAHRSSKRPAG